MSRSAAEELLALEATGVSISRNRNFELFSREGPQRALRLRHRLDAIARLLRRYRDEPGLEVRIEATSGRLPVELCITVTVLSATLTLHLDALEMEILIRDPVAAEVLGAAGLPAGVGAAAGR